MRLFLSFWLIILFLLNGCASHENQPPLYPKREGISHPAVTLDNLKILKGQTIYVPVYVYIYFDRNKRTINLTTTLTIHNTDPTHSIIITDINYHNGVGELVKEYLANPIRLPPLASADFLADHLETTAGSGANFIVKWVSEQAVLNPLVETIMISTLSTQGISFLSRGVVIESISNESLNAPK